MWKLSLLIASMTLLIPLLAADPLMYSDAATTNIVARGATDHSHYFPTRDAADCSSTYVWCPSDPWTTIFYLFGALALFVLYFGPMFG